jgi:hypothetical protein
MTREFELSPHQVAAMLRDLATAERSDADHLTLAELTEFGTALQVEADTSRITRHLALCADCAAQLERLNEASSQYEGEEGRRRLQALSARVLRQVQARSGATIEITGRSYVLEEASAGSGLCRITGLQYRQFMNLVKEAERQPGTQRVILGTPRGLSEAFVEQFGNVVDAAAFPIDYAAADEEHALDSPILTFVAALNDGRRAEIWADRRALYLRVVDQQNRSS